MPEKYYEGMEELTLTDGETIYTGWPSKKEDFFEYYASLDINPESRTDVEEVMNHYNPMSDIPGTRTFMKTLCNKEKSLGLMEFLWYINCHVRNNLRDEQNSLSNKMDYADQKSVYYESMTTRYNQICYELDCIFIHDAGRVF